MNAAIGGLGRLAAVFGFAAAVSATGCDDTEAFCFTDCGAGSTSSSGSGMGNGGAGGCLSGCVTSSGTGVAWPCVPTNGGTEICDRLDNNCDGTVDNIEEFNPNSIHTCGTCDHDCLVVLTNVDPATITCSEGQCAGSCATDFYDLDHDGTCEYYCLGGVVSESICNNIDDDCNGITDDDVDLCTSTTDCGRCANSCAVLNGTAACTHTGTGAACDASNTRCTIASCDCPDANGDCWWNIDGPDSTLCRYQCHVTNGGVEICDGLDNDCDATIDRASDLGGDPRIGVTCSGDPVGECATPAHQGTSICDGGHVVCAGPNVITRDRQAEICNGLDDDCDGEVDDNLTDVGGRCGVSNIFPCHFGTYYCVNAALVCHGATDPHPETCNGVDDDCDGTVDSAMGRPPSDSIGTCNVWPAPPAGVSQPCRAGTKACVGGAIVCENSVGPASTTDACGVDSNCDGALTDPPDLMSDAMNCGSCGHSCYAGAVHSTWACASGACRFQDCTPGYYDLDGDQRCEYACSFIQPGEACNGADDNCNGMIDEAAVAPSTAQVCGVSPAATSAECTTGVSVTCTAGAWRCRFPTGVCDNPGGCIATPEICDALDNNCNGLLNENVPNFENFGRPCNSDDGLPPPGHGACRTTGVVICSGLDDTRCSAVPADCSTLLPAGCTELCDGIDNDCDGLVDEPASNKGTNRENFVRPAVIQTSATNWIYAYEASRPDATAVDPGSGNGYHTSAPPGVLLDRTIACSVPGHIPWFNVSPQEVEQTCAAMGGQICSTVIWQSACQTSAGCSWGFSPRSPSTACITGAVPMTKFCNLGSTYDFDTSVPGNQDGLLPTGSPLLRNCWADWSSTMGNPVNRRLFDITGNLREITTTPAANQYALMGGAFDSESEVGASCNFTFYTVARTFRFYDTGFRCCFSADPTL